MLGFSPFGPFVGLMNRLRYAQKFLLITVLFLIPISLMLFQLVKHYDADLETFRAEQEGAALIREAKPLLVQLQQHRGLANGWLNGDDAAQPQLEAVEAGIAETIAAVDSRIFDGRTVAEDERWSGLKEGWGRLQSEYAELAAPDSFERHTALIAELQSFLSAVADRSRLTLDARLDTHYLAVLTTHELPALMETVGQARGKGNGILASGRIGDDQRIELMLSIRDIDDAVAEMERARANALSYNAALGASLDEPAAASIDAAKRYSATIEDQFVDGSLSMKPADYFEQGTNTIASASALFDVSAAALDRLLAERIEETKRHRAETFVTLAVALLLAMLLFLGFYIGVRRTVNDLAASSKRMADGDLTSRARSDTKDELSEVAAAFNRMAEKIGALLAVNRSMAENVASSAQQLRAMSEQTIGASEELAEAAATIAAGAEQQMQASGETSRAMEEMAIGVQRIAESTAVVSDAAAGVAEAAKRGDERLTAAVGQMHQIHDAVHRSAETVRQLGERSKEIGDITTSIAEITAQTQILSLNAAIEAARAGEAGRGFSVVANEIRMLADRCKEAAASIATIVSEIVGSVKEADEAVAVGKDATDAGIRSIEEVNRMFRDILASARQTAEQIQETSAASEQMSAGTQEITASIASLSDVAGHALARTQTMSASSEELLSSMEEVQAVIDALSDSSARLNEEMEKFKV